MNKKIISLLFAATLMGITTSCDDWLDRDSKEILLETEAYKEKGTINSIIAGLYNRLPDTGGIDQTPSYYTEMDEGMLGSNVNNFISYDKSYLSYYDYTLVRDINYHLYKLSSTSTLSEEEKKYYEAEARFLRAYVYFELVKRMGGVPLVTEYQRFESADNLVEYCHPRNTEAEVYDFVISECDAIKQDLDLTTEKQYNRASMGAALALKCRAALYAGSLSKYNSAMASPITLPGDIVGIPADRADGYYQQCIDAFKELRAMEYYSLYDSNTDKAQNFFEALTKSPVEGNRESIFVKQYQSPTNTHNWTYYNLPRSMRNGGQQGAGGSYVNPSLKLADAFERIDGSDSKLRAYVDPSHEDVVDYEPDAYVYYDNIQDIFKNKDYRFFGTLVTPGSQLGSGTVDMQAGVAYYNEQTGKLQFMTTNFDNANALVINRDTIKENGQKVRLIGTDGPTNEKEATRTGFYVRKWMEPNTSLDAKASVVPFVRFRYGEAMINAAEAAYEIGDTSLALELLNALRRRAGFTTDLKQTSIEQIRNERFCELAFEGQRYYDLRRWRIADEQFNGTTTNSEAMVYGLWPYKVYRPGHATHGKWIYVRMVPTEFRNPRYFTRTNYYSAIPSDALTNNPLLVPNPGQ